jgi:2-polyprenyl-6-methoxyphenol hydroxylase-like FAD-dependent oxidoreductase
MSQEIETTVLIVGGGPVGLLGGHLLGRRGVRTLVAEKHQQRLEAPKAHALNPRSLEICAAAGLPMDRIHAIATATEDGRHVRMVETLSQPPIGVIAYERQDEAVRELTPWPLINIEQPKFEAVIEDAVCAAPDVMLRRGLEWKECLQLGDQVISTLVDRITGETVKVRSRYVIACDGAGSNVREGVGIAMDGPDGIAHFMMIHFEANLRAVVADHPGILYFLFGPGLNGTLIAYDIEKTWVLMHPCSPDTTAEAFDEATCRAAVAAAVGAPVPDLEIKGVRAWRMSAQVARRYRDGNVFLAGDAGHRFPPTGGLGLNTGIGDIDNLAWKIAAVEAGWAGPDLLETYEPERRGIAQTNMGQSLANAFRIRVLFDALGYAPDQTVTAEVFRDRLSAPQSLAVIADAVAAQKDHFDSLRLQLGFAYGDALRDDDTLPISQFTPKCVAGARLPHAVLADGRSTLDLIAPNGFTVLAGPEAGDLSALSRRTAAPLAILADGRDFALSTGAWAERLGLTSRAVVLVRPDGHILAVAAEATPAALIQIETTLSSYLATPVEGAA